MKPFDICDGNRKVAAGVSDAAQGASLGLAAVMLGASWATSSLLRQNYFVGRSK